jgi:Holliday junction DNA helicase RuvA
MIAMLRGVVDTAGSDSAVIDVGGVGYLVYCSTRTLAALPPVGEVARLRVETHVREDHIHLYSFLADAEREWFRMLTTVQGVGARVALAILSVLSPEELLHAVLAEDKTSIVRANGVGLKLAGRVVTELKDKVGESGLAAAVQFGKESAALSSGAPNEEAVSALVNLGFSRSEAFGAIMRAGHTLGDGAPADELIRGGLRDLAQ